MIGEWLLAFAVHSTLWLSLAWLIVRARPQLHARVRETLWHTAIAASLIAPTAQTLAPSDAASFWSLPLPLAWLEAGEDVAASSEAGWTPATVLAMQQAALRGPAVDQSVPLSTATMEATPAWWSTLSLEQVGVGAWLGIGGFLLAVYLLVLRLTYRQMNPRELVETAPERFALTQLSRRAGLRVPPRLTESENISSAHAFGLGKRREICVSTRALHELDHDQFCAMLGHEVAHHMRRDPLRLLLRNLLQGLFWFQPLFRVANRQLSLAAEELCDAWGASHVEDRLAMARCLTEVAAWGMPTERSPVMAGMARRRSQLTTRVNRLMDEGCGFEARGGWMRATGSALMLALAPWLAPTLAPAAPAQDLAFTERDPLSLADFRVYRIEELAQQDSHIPLVGDPLVGVEQARLGMEIEFALILAELGPLAFTPRFESKLLDAHASILAIRDLHLSLHQVVATVFPGEGPSPEASSNIQSTNTLFRTNR